MKKQILPLLALSTLSIGGFLFAVRDKDFKSAKGYQASSLPTTIDLNDSSASDIRSYYSSLNGLSQSQRQGNNLLINLKNILKNGQKYYSYESGTDIWRMYEITDRDWDKSPASSTTYGTYNSKTNIITGYSYGSSASNSRNNPYIHALYINRDVDNQTTAWDNHNQNEWGINREHVWPKAEGFDKDGAGGARGDPMHLMAGNGYSNNIHSNYYYGYVNKKSSYTDCGTTYSNQTGNLRGVSLTVGGSTSVFEPQDCDKGDIARAIFYMVARYNYLSGSDSDGIDANNPNLTLTQSLSDWSNTGYTSSTATTGKMGLLTDLLAWHHADPVDEYEIHRNNLLYTNFTNNRNPFIDFPEWADFIWGTATYNGRTYKSYDSTPTGYAKPSTDTINGYNSGGPTIVDVTGVSLNNSSLELKIGDSETLTATVSPDNATNKDVTWASSNKNIATVEDGVVTAIGIGEATITVTTSDGGYTDTCTVTVVGRPVTGVSLNNSSLELKIGDSETLTATVSPDNATNKDVTWASSNKNIATVEDGVVTAIGIGEATITVTTSDGGYTDTCTVTVTSQVNVSVSIGTYANENSWSNAVKYTSVTIDNVATASAVNGGGNTGKYYTSGNEWRFYQSENPNLVISLAEGYELNSVSVTYNVNNGGVLLDSGSNQISSGSIVNASGDSIAFSIGNSGSATNGQVKVTAISVTYHSASAPAITSITASVEKTYHIGETISKSDITVIDNLDNVITDFTFEDDGYTFKYTDAPSGGSLTNKNFVISYQELETTLTVQVSRVAYVELEEDEIELLPSHFSDAGIGSSSVTGNYTVGGIDLYVYSCYVYKSSTLSMSASKESAPGYIQNATPFSSQIVNIECEKNTSSPAPNLKVSVDGTNWNLLKDVDVYNETYCYFRIDFAGVDITTYTNIISITISTISKQTVENFSNYIMFEDTENQCNSKFDVATGYFNNMTIYDKTTFMTSTDYVVQSARERLQAWAYNQGKEIIHINGDYVVQPLSKVTFAFDMNTDSSILIISLVSIVSLAGLYLFLVNKKKEQ